MKVFGAILGVILCIALCAYIIFSVIKLIIDIRHRRNITDEFVSDDGAKSDKSNKGDEI